MHRIASLSLAAAALAGLAGCGGAPALVIAAYTADGISYAATGKGMTDHALSAALDKDCALLRMVQNESPCKEDGAPAAEQRRTSVAARHFDHVMPASYAPGAMGGETADASGGWVLVLGTYKDADEADYERRRYRAIEAFVAPARVDGRPAHRVIAGPYAVSDLPLMRSLARQSGALDTQAAPVCPEEAPGTRCVGLTRPPS